MDGRSRPRPDRQAPESLSPTRPSTPIPHAVVAGLSGALASCLDFVDMTNIPKCYKVGPPHYN